MDMFKIMKVMRDPKKFIYGGLLCLLLIFFIGVLLGYSLGNNIASQYYLERIFEISNDCMFWKGNNTIMF